VCRAIINSSSVGTTQTAIRLSSDEMHVSLRAFAPGSSAEAGTAPAVVKGLPAPPVGP